MQLQQLAVLESCKKTALYWNFWFSLKYKQKSHLADTMTASPSLHLSAGIDFRHCLDSRKRPGKNIDPAARMVSMVPGDLSERQKVQQAIWSLRSVALSPLKRTHTQCPTVNKHLILISLVAATPMCVHLAALTVDNKQSTLSKSNMWQCILAKVLLYVQ